MSGRECTEAVAQWCPTHGDCICLGLGGTPDCPLHGVPAMRVGGHLGPPGEEVSA